MHEKATAKSKEPQVTSSGKRSFLSAREKERDKAERNRDGSSEAESQMEQEQNNWLERAAAKASRQDSIDRKGKDKKRANAIARG